MLYSDSMSGLFNQDFVLEQLKNPHCNDQAMKLFDCAKKFEDFLTSFDKVEPSYRQFALGLCLNVFEQFMRDHG